MAERYFDELVGGGKAAQARRASNRGNGGAGTPFGVPPPQLPRFGCHGEGDAGFHYVHADEHEAEALRNRLGQGRLAGSGRPGHEQEERDVGHIGSCALHVVHR